MKKQYIPIFIILLGLALQEDVLAMSKKAFKHYENGNKLYSINDLDGAISQYQKALKKDPLEAIIYIKIASIMAEKGDWNSAVSYYRQALTLTPNDASIYTTMGNILQEHYQYEEALQAYQNALKLSPEYKYNYFNIAIVENALGKYKEAIENYKIFLTQYPDHEIARKNLATTYLNLNLPDGAIEQYDILLAKNKNNFDEWTNYGKAFYQKGNYTKSLEILKKAMFLEPENALNYLYAGQNYQMLKDDINAIVCYKRAIMLDPRLINAKLDLANLLAQQKSYEDAIEYYLAYTRTVKDNADAYFNLGVAYENINKINHALSAFRSAFAINPDDPNLIQEIGRCYHVAKNYEQALKFYLNALESKPNDADLLYNIALVYGQMGNNDKTIEYLNKSIAIKENPLAVKDLATAYVGKGKEKYSQALYGQAITLYKKALETDINNIEAYKGLSEIVGISLNSEEILANIKAELETNPNNADLYTAYGEMLFQKNMLPEAKEALLKALELAPTQHTPNSYLAEIYYREQNYTEALKYYEKVLTVNDKKADVLIKIGNIHKNNKNNEEAKTYYKKAIEIEPNNIVANTNIALIYMNTKENEMAKAHTAIVIKEKPEYPISYYINGVIADSEKNYEEAVKNYEKFLNLAPNDADAPIIQKRTDSLKDYLKKIQGVKNVTKRDI